MSLITLLPTIEDMFYEHGWLLRKRSVGIFGATSTYTTKMKIKPMTTIRTW